MKAMQLTRDTVARKLAGYLRHEISLEDWVAWANTAMMEDDFEETHYDVIRDAVARLGLADVRAFGLTWEDCARILKQLDDDTRKVL